MTDVTPSEVGGKATSWDRLRAAGLPVPRGFAIPADAPVDVATITEALTALPGVDLVAVRSSAVGEDSHQQALAGLFESALDVEAEGAAVLAAVLRCRAQGGSARALSAAGRPLRMGVLVQEMVRPSCSGVLFTRDPLGAAAGMVVEAVNGHLRALVEGRDDAKRWLLGDAATPTFEGLDDERLRLIGTRVEEVLGCPADIEWALADGELIVLQARPITSLTSTRGTGLLLVPVTPTEAARLPPAVAQHDKIALRLVAAELGIPISHGYVALATSPSSADVVAAAAALAGWGEFIAVLLAPFDLDGEIFRRFGTGATAGADLVRFVDRVSTRHTSFAFLLKELQETAQTGVAVRLRDGSVHVEIVEGHFITKGFADPSVYQLDPSGAQTSFTPGRQDFAMQVVAGNTVRVAVDRPPTATTDQLAVVHRAAVGLAERYPTCGVEFGFTPEGGFFLVDLYQGAATEPPERRDVLSHGRVVGRVRILDLPEDAAEASVERHVHSRRSESGAAPSEPEILVVRRPLHVLDRFVYEASPGSLGFICEGGALLCHLAVVMREHGVPGLVVADATTRFRDGERLVLDTRPGSAAAVTRLD